MAQSTYTTLIGYFNAGDEPTEAQFLDLVETVVSGQAYSNLVTITTNTTLTDTAHAWRPVVVTGTTVVTLPAVVAGHSYWIINGNVDAVAITIDTHASDKWVLGSDNAASADGEYMINTSGTAKKGDFAKLTYGTTDGWYVTELGGTWDMQ